MLAGHTSFCIRAGTSGRTPRFTHPLLERGLFRAGEHPALALPTPEYSIFDGLLHGLIQGAVGLAGVTGVGDGVVHHLQMRVVHERLEVRSGEAVRRAREFRQVHRGCERDFAAECGEDLRKQLLG